MIFEIDERAREVVEMFIDCYGVTQYKMNVDEIADIDIDFDCPEIEELCNV